MSILLLVTRCVNTVLRADDVDPSCILLIFEQQRSSAAETLPTCKVCYNAMTVLDAAVTHLAVVF